MDSYKSEVGRQRLKTPDGLTMHCCCVCNAVAPWTNEWSWYGSDMQLDDEENVPKFCSEICRRRGGARAKNITPKMLEAARDNEHRDPTLIYREATDQEKYRAAVAEQPKMPR